MKNKFSRSNAIALACLALLFLSPSFAFSQSQAVDYLCQKGESYYEQGKTEEALSEFNKVLLVDPDNKIAKRYVNLIFKKSSQEDVLPLMQEKSITETQPSSEVKPTLSKEDAMAMAISGLEQPKHRKADGFADAVKKDLDDEEKRGFLLGGLRVTGEMLLSFGVASPNDFIWKRANYDMNERNWRVLSDAAYNKRWNTFDTRVYDSLSVNLDTENETGFNLHANITVDPWSFTGKSSKFTVTGGVWGDTADVELRYWSNTGYTLNDRVFTSISGDVFNLPEIKVVNGRVLPTTVTSSFNNTFAIPETKIHRRFQPVREFWLDYMNEDAGVKFRVFPMAYQDQAFTSDDPLRITNHHKWWAASPWLKRYSPGRYNSDPGALDYTKGIWDDSFSTIRDSTGKYLTALRGFSFELGSAEKTLFTTTVATPKDLWQDYEEVDNYITASRLKHFASDNFALGATFTSRIGLNVEDKNKTDSRNYVGGADLAYEILEGMKMQAEVLTSQSYYDEINSQYKTKARGNAYYFTLINRYPQKELISLADAYNESKKGKDESVMVKSKFFIARMDEGFDSALSNYRDTRDDDFWSRHISFRRQFGYFSPGLSSAYVNQDELDTTRIGDGIDKGRSTIGFRIETFYEDNFSNLFDVRNVHKNNGKYVETVVRDEIMFKPVEKLTLKGLLLYQNLPKTKGGIDPFNMDIDTDIGLVNTAVPDGADPSIKTGSIGLEYAFEEWIKANLVWERTNDYYLAYGNFPNGVFNDAELSRIYSEYGSNYRGWNRWLYDQGNFPQAPYPFYNIYKAGIDFSPTDKLNFYLDYTYNEFKMAGQNSDNMNHLGLQMVYEPTEKIGLCFKYTYSLWKNPILVNQGNTKTIGHHNFFAEFRFFPTKDDELTLQYGEGNSSSIGRLYDPTGGSLLTIDTAHIFRAYYRRKF